MLLSYHVKYFNLNNLQIIQNIKQLTWGRIERWRTQSAPFLPYPDVVKSSTSGSWLCENSSDRKAGSPIDILPHGPIFNKLSHTYKI